jgi:cytochrome c oxidase subunit 1
MNAITTHHPTLLAVRRLPGSQRALLAAMVLLALGTLVLGVLLGLGTALVRAGLLPLEPEGGYRLLTGHGAAVFFYWLYLGQGVLLLALVATQARPQPLLALPGLGWAGLGAIAAGLVASLMGAASGTPLLYDGMPELARTDPAAAFPFYLGYLLLALGLAAIALTAIATALASKRETGGAEWSALGFGSVAWAGLLLVSAIAMLAVFTPPALWSLGLAPEPADFQTRWHLLFHNLHYLPLMGTVLVWYALVRELTGVVSIFGGRFSKGVFSLYLVFVPPTSLYHMFLEPNLAAPVRVLGSILSLFVGVPTIAVFLIIVISLEQHARAQGTQGPFGWLKALPWHEPAMSALGMAVVNLALGGTFAFVLIQEKLAPLLSDTFFVPGYFHLLTVGTVSLTLLGAFAHLAPALAGAGLSARSWLRRLPYLVSPALWAFALAGVAAGLQGLPRRVMDAGYDAAAPASWAVLTTIVALADLVMSAGLLAYAGGVGATWLRGSPESRTSDLAPPPVRTGPLAAAWGGPAAVLVLLLAMYAATAVAFELMQALPITAAGAAGH